MTPQQKAEALLRSLGKPYGKFSIALVIAAFEAEYDEGFQNGMNRAHEDVEHERRATGPVA